MDPQTQHESLSYLAALLEEAKQAEAEAKRHRLDIEDRIIDVQGREVEGTRSIETNHYKVKTVSRLERKVDQEKIKEVLKVVGSEIFEDVFRVKYELNKTAFMKLRDANPNKFMMVTSIITTTPTKTSVEVEKLH